MGAGRGAADNADRRQNQVGRPAQCGPPDRFPQRAFPSRTMSLIHAASIIVSSRNAEETS